MDPHLARPAAPSRTIQPASVLTRTGQPGPRHLHPNRSSLDVSPHARLPPTMACTIGPLTLSSFTATVLAHGPVLDPAPPHRHPSCPAVPQTGTSRTILHPGQCSTSPPQPGAALRLIAPPLFGAALVHACLCTSLHRCNSAHGTFQYALRGSLWLGIAPTVHARAGSAHAANRQVPASARGAFA